MAVGTVVSADQSGGGLGRRARDRNSPLSATKAESDPWTTFGRERAAASLSEGSGGMGSRQGWLWAQSSLPITQAAASGGAQDTERAHSPPRKPKVTLGRQSVESEPPPGSRRTMEAWVVGKGGCGHSHPS